MNARSPHATETRRWRERNYRARLVLSVAGAVAVHVLLLLSSVPFSRRIPLVRHIGYHGVLRILPEISVRRDPANVETEFETARGSGSESFFRVINIRAVDWEIPAGAPMAEETGEAVEEDSGEELRAQLESSLPQPTSTDVVLVRFVKPHYPRESIAANVEGVVTFRLHVAETGDVVRAWLIASEVDEPSEVEAHRAVLQWEFRPFLVEGVATAILVDQRIRFRLRDVPVAPPAAPRSSH
jgi:TonB family protein